ncbi:hypothetical protein F4861DRAFT_155629 [Xylaria intraflava]|nr:hypothetical protein F4861DRAFT_155629 [Xylaria intraflava]
MFGGSRRRRPPTAPLSPATANPNATTAAASAYMSAASYNPNKALSSAAAAAALRARPHTPTNVAEVQTKRTIRRSASMSSAGSGPIGAGLAFRHNRLDRPGSSASMTERTFRSPSPHRPSSLAAREHQPPVPQIPDTHRSPTKNSRVPGVGMQNFHTASEKMRNEQSSWHVRPAGDTSNVRRSDSIIETTNSPQSIVDSQPVRPDSRSSPPTLISNPSRRASSHSYVQDRQQLVYDPNSRRMIPRSHTEGATEHQMKQVPKKQPRRRSSSSRHEKSQIVKAKSFPVNENIVDENRDIHEQNRPAVEPSPIAQGIPVQEQSSVETTAPAETLDIPNKSPRLPVLSAPELQSSPPLLQKPYIELSNEPRELSLAAQNPKANTQYELASMDKQFDIENTSQRSLTARDALDAIPTRQILFIDSHPQNRHSEQKLDDNETASAQNFRMLSSIDRIDQLAVSSEQGVTAVENKPVVGLAGASDSLRRSSSNSPARQARFAPRPSERLSVRHTPLPRSASPMKSAMKHASPTLRGTSPPDNCLDPPDQKEELTPSRKKSNRVSFDEYGTVSAKEPTSATEADSSSAQSPQGPRRAWFSNLGRSKKKEFTLDDDETMKPRPALPSFGSIREKKIRELGERPLVRPLEPSASPAISSSPMLRPHSSSTLTDSETTEDPSLGQSSDHAIGAVLLQDQTYRNVANISRFREPLPPVVTSVEGCGYSSESSHGSDGEEHRDSAIESRPPTMIPSILSTPPPKSDLENGSQGASATIYTPQSKQETFEAPETIVAQQQAVKTSMSQPMRIPSEYDLLAGDTRASPHLDVPGAFPHYSAGTNCDSQHKVVAGESSKNGLSFSDAIFEPTTTVANADKEGSLPQTALDTAAVVANLTSITEDESEESIYSDAYEDIPDFDPGEFMSLDAVVESPTNEESRANTYGTPEKLPMTVTTSKPDSDVISQDTSSSQAQLAPPQDASDWEQAKAFWRSLTAEKRRQLELEAAEEAGADGDREDVSQSVRRNGIKKQSPGQAHSTRDVPIKSKSRVQKPLRDESTRKPASTSSQTGMRNTLESNGGTQSTSNPLPRPLSSHDEAARFRTQSSAPSTSKSQLATEAKPTLQRRESDTSDSSFKRNRRSLSSGTIAFRKTMRQTSPIQARFGSARSSGRFSLRSLSPTGITPHHETNTSFANIPPGGMKRTLRSSSQPQAPGKRSSVHFPLFSRSMKASPKESKWTSRFNGSSDEDEATATRFQSRIYDSSDEEDRRPMSARETNPLGRGTLRSAVTTPSLSRPAPVPELEENSPELPDSDDDLMPSPLRTPQGKAPNGDFASHPGMGRPDSVAIGTSTLGRSRSGRGGLASSFTSSPVSATERRGSLLNILRRNKRTDHFGKIQRSEPVDSAVRRDTKLERDSRQLKDLRGELPLAPKLQKRPSVGQNDGSGPRRPVSAGNHLGRSATVGAISGSNIGGRLSFSLGRNSNGGGYEAEATSIEGGGSLKKKKFGTLRRMFKLDG